MGKMTEILDHIIGKQPKENEGAAQLQLSFKNNRAIGGAVRKSEVDGVFELLTPAGRKGPNGQDEVVGMVTIYFDPEELSTVEVLKLEEKSNLVIPRFDGPSARKA